MSEIIRDASDINLETQGALVEKPVPTWAQDLEYKDLLPPLPIPLLEDTLERFLRTVRPLLDNDEYTDTKRKVKVFLHGVGPTLNEELHQLKEESPTSWLEGFWNSMYLEWRGPIPIHINPCFVLQDDPTPSRNAQIPRAAILVSSVLWFYDQIRLGYISPDHDRGNTMCMHQYTRMFATTRIPQFGRDLLHTHYNSKLIAVACRDHYFTFDAYDSDGKPLEIEELSLILKKIVDMSRELEPVQPLGMLTTTDRDTWTSYYHELLSYQDPHNRKLLNKIGRAILLLCLDDTSPTTPEEVGKVILHGDGTNRWFDKSIQLIVCENGKAGINMEHSPMDGTTALRFVEDFYHHSVRTRCDTAADVDSSATNSAIVFSSEKKLKHLNFVLPPTILKGINRARKEFTALVRSTNTHILHFVNFGKGFLVKNKVSPDAFVQVSLQVAYYRLMEKPACSTYESVMTKTYYHGRTECGRTLTAEMLAMLHGFSDPSVTAIQQLKLLKDAFMSHRQIIKSAKKGEGCDRHLYGLHTLAKQRQQRLPGFRMPELFQDAAWLKLRYDVLSTSNCGGYALASFGFGPVVPDGFGVGYIIKHKCMHFHITRFDVDLASEFGRLLELTMKEIGKLLVNGDPIRLHFNKSKM